MSRNYISAIANEKYDAIIIGSGMGGLTAAAFLARAGKKVLILERHDVPGGFTHSFKRKGYEWDVGVHYVGQVGDEKSLMRKTLDYITDSQLKWSPMGEVYDRVIIAGKTYDFVAGSAKQMAQLEAYFPGERAAIQKYFSLVQGFPLSSGLFFGERTMPWWLSATVGWFMRRSFMRRCQRTTYEVLRELTANEELISVLCAQCGDYGLPPRQSSFAVHAGLVDHYMNGGSYPIGGARAIHEHVLSGIESRGGKLALKADVERVLVEGGRAVGVQMKNGDKIMGTKIVSNAGARNTFLRLWPEQNKLPKIIRQGLKEIRPSVAHVCLYVGLKASDEELKLPKHNYWLYDNYNFDADFATRLQNPSLDPALTYISFPSAKDPSWPLRHPGKSTVQVIAPCPYEWVKAWKDQPWMKRDDEYLKFKAQWRDRLLEKLYQVAPQVRGFVDHCEVSTPLSTAHFSNHQCGEIYGLEHTPLRMRARWLRAHTPLKNLYLTGQDIIMVGIGGALFSGVISSVAVLKKNVLWPVLWQRKSKKN